MHTTCAGCHRSVNENTCVTIRGALVYHVNCVPTSKGTPCGIWQALLALVGCWR